MREPALQTRLLASAPVFFGVWAAAAFSLYRISQQDDGWPVLIATGIAAAIVMKADQQVKAYRDWKRDWDAMSGEAPSRARGRMHWTTVVGLLLLLPMLSLLSYAGQHGGSQAVIGIFILLGVPVAAIAGLVQLWRRVRRGRAKRVARVQPVTLAVTRPLLAVPSLREAYAGLPGPLRAIMATAP